MTSAALALKMGLPIFGIVALTTTASDKEGRSIPAPGKGVLTSAREVHTSFKNPLLDFGFRKKNCEKELADVQKWKESELKDMQDK